MAAELAETSLAVPPRYIADDCTPEQLATLLKDHGGRIAVLSPEGDVFDLLAGRYSTNASNNFGVYLKGHTGDAIRVDRVGRPGEFVDEPALTVGLAVQPEVISGLADKPGFRGRGLLARFLYALPVSLLGRRKTNPEPLPEEIRSAYETHLIALLDLPYKLDATGSSRPHLLRFSPEAHKSLNAFSEWVEPLLSEFGELGGMTDWGGKLVGAVVRIAGLLHMANLANADEPWNTAIPAATLENAICIGKYLIPHAKAAFSQMGADVNVERAKQVMRWIKHSQSTCFSKRDAHQALRGTIRRVADVEAPLAVLVDLGYIRLRPTHSPSRAGRPDSPEYEVNPLCDPQNAQNSPSHVNCEDCEDCEKPLGKSMERLLECRQPNGLE